jgi:hypothetical protein
VVDYVDQEGERHIETFDKKKDADGRHAQVNVNVSSGIHVAPSKSKRSARPARVGSRPRKVVTLTMNP